MSNQPSRRDILSAVSTGVCVSVAGCAGVDTPPRSTSTSVEAESDSPSPTSSPSNPIPFTTPASDECELTEPPHPTPTGDFQPEEYPTYPDSLTVNSAETFAEQYEEAYQYNLYLAERVRSDTTEVSTYAQPESDLSEAKGTGFLVGIEGTRSTTWGRPTAVTSDDPIVGVYYLTPEFALRGDISEPTLYKIESLSSIKVQDMMTIYCQSNG